jgi:hypothetical protein
LTLFQLLKQMSEGSETDPQTRIAELHKRRDAIDAEIARIQAGDIPLLDDTAVKDRFQQFIALARELLSDFREVEHHFRLLDRRVRKRIALWEGARASCWNRSWASGMRLPTPIRAEASAPSGTF